MPDNPISVREEDLSPVEYEEPLPEVPPFGMTEDQLAAYASALAERVTNQVTGLDTNEELGYQVVEGSDLGAVLVATMQEIEQAMIGCAMVHMRVARGLKAAEAMGIAGGDESPPLMNYWTTWNPAWRARSEEHTSELQSRDNLECRLL